MITKIPAHSHLPAELSKEEYDKLKLNKATNIVSSIVLANNNTVAPSPVKAVVGIKVFRSDAQASHEMYSHNTFDIVYLSSGNATVTVASHRFDLKEKCLLFIAPGVPYTIETDNESIIPVIVVEKSILASHFHQISKYEGVLPRYFANSMWGEFTASYIYYSRTANNYIHILLNLLIGEEISSAQSSFEIKVHLLLSALGYVSGLSPTSYEIATMKITRSDQLAKILTYIQENYRTVTLDKLANNFHYTVPYVSKLIRSATGLTFTDILREIKFDVCRSLLMNSDLKINKIAEIAGFQNTDHFNRIFKKRMGETPTDYKKNRINTGIDN